MHARLEDATRDDDYVSIKLLLRFCAEVSCFSLCDHPKQWVDEMEIDMKVVEVEQGLATIVPTPAVVFLLLCEPACNGGCAVWNSCYCVWGWRDG